MRVPMTVIVTRDVPDRTRGFLASVMPEPAPGVYVAGELSKAIRGRIWIVLSDWHDQTGRGSVPVIWRDAALPGGVAVEMLGIPPRKLPDLDGVLVCAW